MYDYMSKYKGKLFSSHADQIVNDLRRRRATGEIRSINDLRSEYQRLVTRLLENVLTPTTKIYEQVSGADTDPEQYNAMLRSIGADLKAAFAEANNIFDLLQAHNLLLEEAGFGVLEAALDKIEREVEKQQLIKARNYGFKKALPIELNIVESDTTASSNVSGAPTGTDPRTMKVLGSNSNLDVDRLLKGITLPVVTESYSPLLHAEVLVGSTSYASEIEARVKTTNVANVIDGTTDTYWIEPLLVSEPIANGAKVELAVFLPSLQRLDFVELHPLSDSSLRLTALRYIDSNNTEQSLSVGTITVSGPTRVAFPPVMCTKLVLQFTQTNYTEVQFEESDPNSNFQRVIAGESHIDPSLESQEEISTAVESPFLSKTILGLSDNARPMKRMYEYLVGMDNIFAGSRRYDNAGVYVTPPVTLHGPGILGVASKEYRPIVTSVGESPQLLRYTYSSDSSTSYEHRASVEYWVVVAMRDKTGDPRVTYAVPLLPLNAERIHHEKLILTHNVSGTSASNDGGALMFFTEASHSTVTVYEDMIPLAPSTDWDFVSSSHSSGLTVETAFSGKRMSRGIQIKKTFSPRSVFTVTYTPTFSASIVIPPGSDLDVVDLTGNGSVRLVQDGNIVIVPSLAAPGCVSSEVRLAVVMRSLTTKGYNMTPVVKSLTLLYGEQ